MKFTKMQATGNDFVVVDGINNKRNWQTLAKEICDRHFGVGADGLIIFDVNEKKEFVMRIFNADGSEAEMCGNGIRCFAKYAVESGITKNLEIPIHTLAGLKIASINNTGGIVKTVKVDMGKPTFKAKEIPVTIETTREELVDITDLVEHGISIEEQNFSLSFVSMGNPHAVTFINSPVSEYPLALIGPKVENHKMFPKHTNFEIARLVKHNTIEVRVWERGVGETMACGTGACATAVVAIKKGYANKKIDIIMPGGILTIEWDGKNNVFMTGSAEEVFKGDWSKT
jgi:diaminopimelate epimerase